MRIGELSRELEKANNQYALPAAEKSKEQMLAEAGISTITANRYQQLVGPPLFTHCVNSSSPIGPGPQRALVLRFWP
jgi:hypothetical protein